MDYGNEDAPAVNLGELFPQTHHATPSSYEKYRRMRYTNQKVFQGYLARKTTEQREAKYQFCL